VLVDRTSESIFVFDHSYNSSSSPLKAQWIRWNESKGCSTVEIELPTQDRFIPCILSGHFLITKRLTPAPTVEVFNLRTWSRFEIADGAVVAINDENSDELCVADTQSDKKQIKFIDLNTGDLSQPSLTFSPSAWPEYVPPHRATVSCNNYVCAVATEDSVVLIRRDTGKIVGWFFASNDSELRQIVQPKVALIGYTAMVVASKYCVQLVIFRSMEGPNRGALTVLVVDSGAGSEPRKSTADPRQVFNVVESSLHISSECLGSITKKLPDGATVTIYFDKAIQASPKAQINQYVAEKYGQYEEVANHFSSYRFESKPPLPAFYKFAAERIAAGDSSMIPTPEKVVVSWSTYSAPKGRCVLVISPQ
jgi:hypothetical protein